MVSSFDLFLLLFVSFGYQVMPVCDCVYLCNVCIFDEAEEPA